MKATDVNIWVCHGGGRGHAGGAGWSRTSSKRKVDFLDSSIIAEKPSVLNFIFLCGLEGKRPGEHRVCSLCR